MQYNNRLIVHDYLHTRLFQSIRGGPGMLAATIAVLMLLFTTTTGHAQTPPELFTPVVGPAEAPTSGPAKMRRWVIRQTYATVNTSLLINAGKVLNNNTEANEAPKITLNLFPDANFVVVIDRVRVSGTGGTTVYFGHLEGNEYSNVTIGIGSGGHTVARVTIGNGRSFKVQYFSDNIHVIKEIDDSKRPPHRKPIIPPLGDDVVIPEGIEHKESQGSGWLCT